MAASLQVHGAGRRSVVGDGRRGVFPARNQARARHAANHAKWHERAGSHKALAPVPQKILERRNGQTIEIFTDGACKGNREKAAGVRCCLWRHEKELFGGEAETTNKPHGINCSDPRTRIAQAAMQVRLHTDSQCAKSISE